MPFNPQFHDINHSLLDRLRKNKNLEVNTIDCLCRILNCRVEDIMEYIPGEKGEH